MSVKCEDTGYSEVKYIKYMWLGCGAVTSHLSRLLPIQPALQCGKDVTAILAGSTAGHALTSKR